MEVASVVCPSCPVLLSHLPATRSDQTHGSSVKFETPQLHQTSTKVTERNREDLGIESKQCTIMSQEERM
jgi:hypothetical protein